VTSTAAEAAGKPALLGVDIGGTKVAVGLVSTDGQILSQLRAPMAAHDGPEAAFAAVTGAIDALRVESGAQIRGIGICAPGPLDPRSGVVLNPPNLPCWRNFPLAAKAESKYGIRVKVDNDANAAALAETRWGAARGYRYVFYTTIGTGIGTGIVFDGEIYHGYTGSAGEGGHMSIDYRGPRCGCGKLGCIEAHAAGPYIAARAREKIAARRADARKILELANGDVNAVTTRTIGEAYAAGDPLAREILQETADLLTIWLGNIIDLLDPDVIVIGGGVAAMLKPFFQSINEKLPAWSVNPKSTEIPIVIAHYGADAGIAGGAALIAED
jgi:glucokinase